MGEIWLDIPGTGGLYEASSLGRIRSKDGAVAARSHPRGYLRVRIRCAGQKSQDHFVHRLVALAFLGERQGLEVNHVNGCKTDNRAENLEWVTHSENVAHAYRIGLTKSRVRPVVAFNRATSERRTFPSRKSAREYFGDTTNRIGHALAGRSKTSFGWEFRYA